MHRHSMVEDHVREVTLALKKIGSHIQNPDKFSKAAGLLRQLLDSGALTKAHRDLLFEVVKLEVYRIVGFLQNEMHTDDSFVFNKVLGRIKDAVAALPPATDEDEEAMAELQEAAAGSSSSDEEGGGDDAGDSERQRQERPGSAPSSTGRMEVKEMAAAEEEKREGSDSAAAVATAVATEVRREADADEEAEEQPEPRPAAPRAEFQAAPAAAAPPPPPEDAATAGDGYDESDPFGLDQLLPAPKRFKAAAPPAPPSQPQPQGLPSAAGQGDGHADKSRTSSGRGSNAWTAAQSLVMRRQALVECLITARGFHKTPWARVSVELLVEHYNKHRDRFTAEQQMAVDEMKEINRDTTSFERARSDWSRATLSARGKVGASGDAKAQNWLGCSLSRARILTGVASPSSPNVKVRIPVPVPR
ncbi:hypothetical protein VOLCADRAFT_120892 [Volvox carteri f. nagariensis]|uniref:Uncharacterized protein n=1 Tax=Volvox carteri f. nagariensis TaxID=3068 RepID=D8TW57_VOLCA|nr:uncharacterized protein VOLCADRAFT_120892 [Volvox carteri f. nagariensis]EFJ48312.1 hypothetical protein VOLCADRAFT_120892 [Volvox carteri f. nagariensis]|eukprot:XP_002950566.1 hypothetical protein VOLCADRAFT_120892 [Volvox carteri f. nagariensis]